MRGLLIAYRTSVSWGDTFLLALFPGLSMYQVVQKKFNLCTVVNCNWFISPVSIVPAQCFSFPAVVPALHI